MFEAGSGCHCCACTAGPSSPASSQQSCASARGMEQRGSSSCATPVDTRGIEAELLSSSLPQPSLPGGFGAPPLEPAQEEHLLLAGAMAAAAAGGSPVMSGTYGTSDYCSRTSPASVLGTSHRATRKRSSPSCEPLLPLPQRVSDAGGSIPAGSSCSQQGDVPVLEELMARSSQLRTCDKDTQLLLHESNNHESNHHRLYIIAAAAAAAPAAPAFHTFAGSKF